MADKQKTLDFLALARKRFKLCEDAEREPRLKALDDLKFRKGDGEQWPQSIRAERDRIGKPCLELNVLPARERQILNNQRQNRPQAHVSPVDDFADVDTAEALEGLIRHIWYDSNADAAIDTGFAAMVRGGFGYVRLITEQEEANNPFNKNLVLKIKRIRNAFSVYLDPNYQEADGSDAKYGFIFTSMSRDEYNDAYKGKKFKDEEGEEYESELCALTSWAGVGDRAPEWVSADNSVRIAEYYYTEREKKTFCRYSDGSSGMKDPNRPQAQGVTVVEEAEAECDVIKWAKINGIEILEETEWPGKYVPIIPILGDELDVDGKRVLEGMVRHTKDAIRMSNYMASGLVQSIAGGASAQWLAPAGTIEKYKDIWKRSGDGSVRVLPYDPIDIAGKPALKPELVNSEPPIQALAEARSLFGEDLKSITGIEDAQLGRRSNEQSGRAINARKQQGELANLHYSDNLTRAIGYLCRQIIDVAPKIIDTARVMRILGEDGTQDTVQFNGHMLPPEKQQGLKNLYNLQVGRYDVIASSGPSYETKRKEQADFMVDMAKAYPGLMATSADLVFKTQDVAGAKELAERQRKAISMNFPGLIEDEDQEPIPPQAQQQIAKAQQENQALHAYLGKVVEPQLQKLQQEKDANILDNQAKMEIEKVKIQGQIDLEMLKAENARAIAEYGAKTQDARERAKIDADLDDKEKVRAHEFAMSAVGTQQSGDLAEQQHAHTLQQGEQGHQQTLEQGDAQAENQAALGSQTHEQTLEQQQQAAKLAPKPAPKK